MTAFFLQHKSCVFFHRVAFSAEIHTRIIVFV